MERKDNITSPNNEYNDVTEHQKRIEGKLKDMNVKGTPKRIKWIGYGIIIFLVILILTMTIGVFIN
ncbi:hypothetical protein [Priestia megaterium]|uniref:hypothetical protein n=1 Tax=Priestia megaterium TaxID=1404 RepID=UPI002E1CB3B6|nr:hypothetical protein [Priestia megaterium]MED4252825.1 hypothetical protein [Priestia megaterium]MED4265827.1 hypothetical protein [Priestia megaterium]MED4275151.1 hypothetical protein [Priestia megaterium]MED4315537.1 hypothetical protein [Priestia megaterium]